MLLEGCNINSFQCDACGLHIGAVKRAEQGPGSRACGGGVQRRERRADRGERRGASSSSRSRQQVKELLLRGDNDLIPWSEVRGFGNAIKQPRVCPSARSQDCLWMRMMERILAVFGHNSPAVISPGAARKRSESQTQLLHTKH
uniref:Uncharacterized protein n=1 Tax=Knipowitschia caucasica TaxID=637954 RepID=A0AAV2M4Z0_KNICA